MERFFLIFLVFSFFTSNPANAAPKGKGYSLVPREVAEQLGMVCNAEHNRQEYDPAAPDYKPGMSFCVGGLPLGRAITDSGKDFSKLEENIRKIPGWVEEMYVECSHDHIKPVGCQNGLDGKSNSCMAGVALARCLDATNLLKKNGFKGRIVPVFLGIEATRQVVFILGRKKSAPGHEERCTEGEISAASKIKLAGDHTEPIKDHVVILVQGQKVSTDVVERVVTLTIPGHSEVGEGMIMTHPEQVRTCRVGLKSAGALPPDPPDGYPPSLRPAPAPVDSSYSPPELRSERETNCNNRIDDDGDGKIDCADDDCRDHAAICQPQDEICDDGIDNDRDGFVDKDDSDCLKRPDPPSKINLQAYFMGLQERPPREEFRHMEDPGLEWSSYTNFQLGLGIPFHVASDMVLTISGLAATRTTEYTEEETVGPLLGDKHAWVVGGEISLLKKVGKDLWAGVEPGFYYGTNGVDPFVNGKIQLQVTPRVGVAVVLGVRYVENHLTEEAVFIPRLGLQISFSLDPIFQ